MKDDLIICGALDRGGEEINELKLPTQLWLVFVRLKYLGVIQRSNEFEFMFSNEMRRIAQLL